MVHTLYAGKLSCDLHNPLWRDLLHILAEFCKMLPVENKGQTVDSPLWYNEKMNKKTGLKGASEKYLILLGKMVIFTLLNN